MGNGASAEERRGFGKLHQPVEELQTMLKQFIESSPPPDPLLHPPAESQFAQGFVLEEYVELAKLAHDHSPYIQQKRFKLVPQRIKEGVFWRNIIYQFLVFHKLIDLETDLKKFNESENPVVVHEQEDDQKRVESPREDFFQVLANIKLCYLYQLPQMFSATGYYASQWDLANPFFTGYLHLVSNSKDEMQVRVFSKEGELFVASSIIPTAEIAKGEKQLEYFVEPVKDSSRYYVIRVEDVKSGKKASLGLGFHDRAHSFNFNTAMTDFVSLSRRQLGLVPKGDSLTDRRRSATENSVLTVPDSVRDQMPSPNVSAPSAFQLTGTIRLGPVLGVAKTSSSKKSSKLAAVKTKEDQKLTENHPEHLPEPEETEWGDFVSTPSNVE
eukprot:TRINITY_DN686_c0_g3_i1.p1 TRINITY_DN686_c0_g3~~TRINITY_DN686_c0_g3_i1.p1  ORF type:complete len:384 (-),score=107.43 TRINITY_DN686_c0_g3_i1:1141-2292(-)